MAGIDPRMLAGGGAPPMAGGGGMPAGGGGGGAMIQQVLQRLMQDPNAIKGMMNFMQGMSPTQGMPMPPSQGGGMPPGMPPGPQGMRGPPGPPNMPPMSDAPPQGPGPEDGGDAEDPEAMVNDEIDNAGNTWDGVDAPTKNDIERLKEDPTPSVIKSFNEQFGDGAAEKYIGGGGDEGGEGDAPEEGGNTDDDPGDHEYR